LHKVLIFQVRVKKTEVDTIKLLITDENGNEILGYARFTMPKDSGEKMIKAECWATTVAFSIIAS